MNKGIRALSDDSFMIKAIGQKTLIEVLEFLSRYKDIDNELDTLTVYIDSDGGDIQVALCIYDMLLSLSDDIELTTIALSKCYSSANVIFKAGAEQYAYPHTTFMVHNIIDSYEEEDIKKVLAASKYTNLLNEKMYDILNEGLTQHTMQAAVQNGEYWFNGLEACSWGYITELI